MGTAKHNYPLPAIKGGQPVREHLLPYGRQAVDPEDIQSVIDVLRSDWLTSGPKVGEFEEAVAAYVGALAAYGSGSPQGVAQWITHCAKAIVAGAEEGGRIADAVLVGRLT